MADEVKDLDAGVSEYFQFKIQGKVYRMRYPTSEEADEATAVQDDDKKATAWLVKFIEPVDKDAPPIIDVLNKINIRQRAAFNAHVIEQFTGVKQEA